MNKYKVMFQSSDQRVWTVTLKADYLSDDGFLIRFWRKHGPFGLLRIPVHYIQADVLISIQQE